MPSGSTPNSLALTPDGKILFVANADNNNLAVFDVSHTGSQSLARFYSCRLVSDIRPRDARRQAPAC